MAGIAALGTAAFSAYNAATASPTANNVNVPQPWIMPNMTGAANAAYGGIQNLPGQDLPPQLLDMFKQYATSLQDNPYASQYQAGSNTAAPMGQAAAQSAYGAGQYFQNAGQSLVPYAQQVANTAFDPQNALYDYTRQKLVDQTRAGQAARGVATTPYGAEGEADQLRKFNIDWQNQQLNRQIAGGQAAGGIIGQGGQVAGGGAAMSASAIPQYVQSGGLPYSTYNTIGQGQIGATSALASGAQGAQQLGLNPVQAYLQYLGLGNQAGGVANQAAQVGLNQANLGFNQQRQLGQDFGNAMAGGVNAFKGGSTNFPGATSAWNWMNTA